MVPNFRQLANTARNLWFLFPHALILSLSSRHEKIIKWHLFCSKRGEKIIIWVKYGWIWQCFHSNNDVFTQKSWRLESERTRGKSNHKFRSYTNSQNSIISFGYVDSYPYAIFFLNLNPPFENSTTHIAILCRDLYRCISNEDLYYCSLRTACMWKPLICPIWQFTVKNWP